jgi:hypothetical protein
VTAALSLPDGGLLLAAEHGVLRPGGGPANLLPTEVLEGLPPLALADLGFGQFQKTRWVLSVHCLAIVLFQPPPQGQCHPDHPVRGGGWKVPLTEASATMLGVKAGQPLTNPTFSTMTSLCCRLGNKCVEKLSLFYSLRDVTREEG